MSRLSSTLHIFIHDRTEKCKNFYNEYNLWVNNGHWSAPVTALDYSPLVIKLFLTWCCWCPRPTQERTGIPSQPPGGLSSEDLRRDGARKAEARGIFDLNNGAGAVLSVHLSNVGCAAGVEIRHADGGTRPTARYYPRLHQTDFGVDIRHTEFCDFGINVVDKSTPHDDHDPTYVDHTIFMIVTYIESVLLHSSSLLSKTKLNSQHGYVTIRTCRSSLSFCYTWRSLH